MTEHYEPSTADIMRQDEPQPRVPGQAEFEASYRAKFPRVVFGVDRVSMPCTCEGGGRPTHWAAVHNSPEAIAEHLRHEECLKWLRERE